MSAQEIAEKYVYGNHDALTDNQEIKDMTVDITNFATEQKKELLEALLICKRDLERSLKHGNILGITNGEWKQIEQAIKKATE